MKQSAFIPGAESLVASVSPAQTKSKLREAFTLTRASVCAAGRWRKLPHAAACFLLALLLLVAASFAPPGLWASVCAVLGTALFLLALYFGLEVDHAALKQAVAYFAQSAEKAASNSAPQESRGLAQTNISLSAEATNQQASEMLASGSSLEDLRQYYAAVLGDIRAEQQTLQERNTNASRALEAAEREARQAAGVFEDRARHWWPGRLLPTYTRSAALRWLSALERTTAARLDQAATAEAMMAYQKIAESIAALADDCSTARAKLTSAAAEAGTHLQTAREHQNTTGCNKSVPPPEGIVRAVEEYVQANAAQIRHAVASRSADQTLADAIKSQAEAAARAVRLPRTFREFYAGLNGSKQLLLRQIDRQSEEFAAATPSPGRQRIRHRFLLAEGGEASQACKDVAALSRDMLVRMADNANPYELVILTEERFLPVGELPEYIEGVRHLQSLAPEKRAPMIVAVENDETLTSYTPESSQDPSRPLRLLCVGLALQILQRTGAECYRLVNRNDPNAPHFAKGFDDAVDKLTTDGLIARQIEQSIDTRTSVEGADAIRKKLLEAKTKNLVPGPAMKRFRESLDEEALHLSSESTAHAA